MPYVIINYRPDGTEVSAAEFVKKTRSPINFTKTHGLGSGIYGLIEGTNTDRAGNEIMSAHTLANPVILDTNAKSDDFSWFSGVLMTLVETFVNGGVNLKAKHNAIFAAEKSRLEMVKDELFPAIGDAKSAILKVMQKYKKDYKAADFGDFLYQPINYLLSGFYDGIYNSSPNGNTLSTGSVYFSSLRPRHQKYAFNGAPFLDPANKLVVGGKYRKTRRRRQRVF